MLQFITDIRGPHNLNQFPADWTSVLRITFVQQDPPSWNFDQRHQNTFVQQDPPSWNFDQRHQNKVNVSPQFYNNGMKHHRNDVFCRTWREDQSLTLRPLANLCFTAWSPQSGALAILLFWQLSLGSCHRRFLGHKSPISYTSVTEGQTIYHEPNTTAHRHFQHMCNPQFYVSGKRPMNKHYIQPFAG